VLRVFTTATEASTARWRARSPMRSGRAALRPRRELRHLLNARRRQAPRPGAHPSSTGADAWQHRQFAFAFAPPSPAIAWGAGNPPPFTFTPPPCFLPQQQLAVHPPGLLPPPSSPLVLLPHLQMLPLSGTASPRSTCPRWTWVPVAGSPKPSWSLPAPTQGTSSGWP
jgi:hypothetical protein